MGFTLYGILAALAMAAMLGVTALAGRKRGLTYSRFIRFAVLAIPLSFLLSRAVYCLATLSYYTETIEQPAMMLQVHDGGYAMLGAMLGVLLAALLSAKWTKLPAADLLDALALGMPCALIIARLAEPLSSMGLTEIGWGQEHASPLFAFLDEICEGRHPVFAYEAIAAVVMLIALLFIRRNARRGDVFWAFLLLFGCSQSVLESMFSTTKHMMFLFVHITQVAALIMALIPLVVWSRRIPRPDLAAKLRLAAAWTLAIACIASALVEEIKVTGADRVEAIKPFVPVVLAAGVGFFCVMWRKEGLLRLLPVIAAGVIAIAAVIIDQTPLVGDHFLLVLWGVMALDMFMLCWTGLRLRAAAEHNDPDCED
jgi:phosphatidylglycerol:prolipoprotein diacylglycerol transferase